MRISNGMQNFNRYFENKIFIDAFGFAEFNSFENSVYIYEIGDYKNSLQELSIDANDIQLINYLLRKVQVFLNCLWLVKDNSITCEIGFMQVYDRHPALGTITSNGISNLPSTSDGYFKETTFTATELDLAITYFKEFEFDKKSAISDVSAHLENPLSKGSKRIDRAFYFLANARNSAALPLKAINYCTLLECLFTNDSGEITHKVSERFSIFVGKNFEERKELFKLAKDLYKIRSKAIHGQPVGASPDQMRILLNKLDTRVRDIFKLTIEDDEKCAVFKMNNEDFDNWFLDLILK